MSRMVKLFSASCWALPLLAAALDAQGFDVASVKPSPNVVGKDYNNRIVIGPATFSGKNVTLKRLIVEAYGVDPPQVVGGPKWLDESEYDVEAKAGQPAAKEQLRMMLRPLLAERFHLAIHRESRELKLYELAIDKGGPKIRPVKDSEGAAAPLGSGHFHGDLQQLANLISVQLTIVIPDDPTRPGVASGSPVPVLDKTGLSGIYDFDVRLKPEAGADPFTLWQRLLEEQLGLKLVSRRTPLECIVVDSAERVPVAN